MKPLRRRMAGAAACFAVMLLSAGSAIAQDEDGMDLYLAVEATSHSNVPLLSTPQDDVYFVFYGGGAYRTSSSTKTLETGLKGRFTKYVDFDNYDNAELQAFCNFDVDTARGDFGGGVRFGSLKEVAGQDLLVLDRHRRNRLQVDADYNAVYSRTSLKIGVSLDSLNYTETALNNLDYLGMGASITIGWSTDRTDIGFRYAHGATNYSDGSREDYSTDFFGLGMTYETGPHLAIGGHLGYAMADSTSVEENSVNGLIKATYSASEDRTLLMFAYSQDFLPSSIGNFSNSMKIEVSARRMFNETLKGELALTHESSEYNTGDTVNRTQVWGGLSAELGSDSVAYFKVARVMYGEQGGATIPGDYTVITIGFKYGF